MKTKIYSLMLLALPIVSACSNQDIEESAADRATLQVNLKNCLSRSVMTGSSLPDNSELGIFVADNNNSVSYSNVNGVVRNDYCLLDASIPLGSDPNYVFAYYPYSSSNSSATSIAYDATSQTDFLIGYSDDGTGVLDYVDSSKPTANMLLTHALARVTLRVKKSAENTNNGVVTSVALDSVSTAGSANLLTHTSIGSTIGTISIATSKTLSTSEETSFDLLVAPTSSLDYSQLILTIDGSSYATAIPTSRTPKWEAGKQYIYTIEVGENANIKISNPEITLWHNNDQSEIIISRALEISTAIENTRAVVTGSSFAEGDKIGLFAYNANGTPYDSINVSTNVETTLTSSLWLCSPKISLTSEKAIVYGYYPYDANADISGKSIKIDVNRDWKLGQRDYMYSGAAEADYSNYKPNLTFKHALARLTLAIKKSSTDKGDGKITGVKLFNGESNGSQGTELAETGWMSLVDGEITRIEDAEDTLSLDLNQSLTVGNVTNIELLVLPNLSKSQTSRSTSPVVCSLTIDGTEHEFTIQAPQWYAGEQYTYPITLNRQ